MTEPHKSLIEGNTYCIIVKQLIIHPVFYMNYCFLSVVERLEEGICCEVGGGDIPTPEQKLWDMQYALDMPVSYTHLDVYKRQALKWLTRSSYTPTLSWTIENHSAAVPFN